MKIRIDEQNREKLQAALDGAQGSCTVRMVTVSDLLTAVQEITGIYSMIPKKALHGCRWDYEPGAQNFPSAYRWRPESTVCGITYSNGKYYLTSAGRYTTSREGHEIEAHLSEAAQAALLEAYRVPYKHHVYG